MTGNEKFRLKVVDDLRKNRVIVESDEEYIALLKKANKDLGDLVRERDEQLAASQAQIKVLRDALEHHQEQTRPIQRTIDTLTMVRPQGKSVVPFLARYQATLKLLYEVIENGAAYLEQTATCNSDRAVAATMRKALATPTDDSALRELLKAEREKYDELLYAVQSKHPGETRHETALRYIRNAERGDNNCSAK